MLTQRGPGDGVEAFRFVLDRVERFDPSHRFVSELRARLLRLHELPSRMRPTRDFDNLALALGEDLVVAGVRVAL